MTEDQTEAFVRLVAEMRHNQKEYFRTKSTAALEAAKRLETKVDRTLEFAGKEQKTLF
jgi:hypothetical protein